MDFTKFEQFEDGHVYNPHAAKQGDEWLEGAISVEFLQEHFGHCKDFDECIATTDSEGLKLFFEHLKTQQ